jgi:hypothetical protein
MPSKPHAEEGNWRRPLAVSKYAKADLQPLCPVEGFPHSRIHADVRTRGCCRSAWRPM